MNRNRISVSLVSLLLVSATAGASPLELDYSAPFIDLPIGPALFSNLPVYTLPVATGDDRFFIELPLSGETPDPPPWQPPADFEAPYIDLPVSTTEQFDASLRPAAPVNTPEPATAMLIGLGLVLFSVFSRRVGSR